MTQRERKFEVPVLGGLPPWPGNYANTRLTSVAFNMRVIETGLESTGPPMFWGRIPYEETWPFPQMFQKRWTQLLLGQSRIYRIYPNGTIASLAKGLHTCNKPWHGALFGNTAVLMNGKSAVYISETDEVKELDDDALEAHGMAVGSCCTAFNGQLLVGAPWAYGEEQVRWVLWSRPGSWDMRLEQQRNSGAGFAHMSWGGRVLAILPHRNGPVVYGSMGISQLILAPAPAMYGERIVTSDIGIHGPLAVCGDLTRHILLGSDCTMYQFNSDSLEPIGYADYFKGLASACVSLNFNRSRSEVYIGH